VTDLEKIEADWTARRSAMTQAERDAEDAAYQEECEDMLDRWCEATAAASFGLTLAEYRRDREPRP
jgi:hypothetical protein